MSKSLELKQLDLIATTGKMAELAAELANETDATMAKLAEFAPALSKQMVALKIIDSTLEEKAASLLKNPVKVAEIFGNCLTHMAKKASETTKAASNLGSAIPDARQSAPSNDNYVGRRRPANEKTAADDPLLRLANLG